MNACHEVLDHVAWGDVRGQGDPGLAAAPCQGQLGDNHRCGRELVPARRGAAIRRERETAERCQPRAGRPGGRVGQRLRGECAPARAQLGEPPRPSGCQLVHRSERGNRTASTVRLLHAEPRFTRSSGRHHNVSRVNCIGGGSRDADQHRRARGAGAPDRRTQPGPHPICRGLIEPGRRSGIALEREHHLGNDISRSCTPGRRGFRATGSRARSEGSDSHGSVASGAGISIVDSSARWGVDVTRRLQSALPWWGWILIVAAIEAVVVIVVAPTSWAQATSGTAPSTSVTRAT